MANFRFQLQCALNTFPIQNINPYHIRLGMAFIAYWLAENVTSELLAACKMLFRIFCYLINFLACSWEAKRLINLRIVANPLKFYCLYSQGAWEREIETQGHVSNSTLWTYSCVKRGHSLAHWYNRTVIPNVRCFS